MVLSVFANNKVVVYQLLVGTLRRRPGHHPTLLRSFGWASQVPLYLGEAAQAAAP
jgi:hypothetical protein